MAIIDHSPDFTEQRKRTDFQFVLTTTITIITIQLQMPVMPMLRNFSLQLFVYIAFPNIV